MIRSVIADKNLSIDKRRIHYMDIARGLLILLLPIRHFESAGSRIPIDLEYSWIITDWQFLFYGFHMAAFFFISGFVSNFEKTAGEYYQMLWRKVFIPIVFFQVVMVSAVCCYRGDLAFLKEGLLQPPYTTIWFLWAILFSKMAIYALKKVFRPFIVVCVAFAVLVLGVYLNSHQLGINVFCIYQAMIGLFFVAVGWYMKNHDRLYRYFLWAGLFIYPILLILHKVVHLGIPRFAAQINISVMQIPFFVVVALSGTSCVLQICRKLPRLPIVERFGRSSIVVYALHFIPLYIIVDQVWHLMEPKSFIEAFFALIIIYLMEYLVCYLLILLFERKPFSMVLGR